MNTFKFFLLFCIIACQLSLSAGVSYDIREVAIDSGDNVQLYLSFNNEGNIVGRLKSKDLNSDFFWSSSSNAVLITDEPTQSRPCINNIGQVAGFFLEQSTGIYMLYLYDSANGFKAIPLPIELKQSDVKKMCVLRINDSGQILFSNVNRHSKSHFGIWDNGHFLELPASLGIPLDLNNQSDILWSKLGNNDGNYVLSNLDSGEIIEFNVPENHQLFKINDKRQAIGFFNDGENIHGIAWSPESGEISLGEFIPLQINSLGHMVGTIRNEDSNPAVWLDGQIINLIASVDFSGIEVPDLELQWAIDINDHGQILIEGKKAGMTRYFILDRNDKRDESVLYSEMDAYYDFEIDRIAEYIRLQAEKVRDLQ